MPVDIERLPVASDSIIVFFGFVIFGSQFKMNIRNVIATFVLIYQGTRYIRSG